MLTRAGVLAALLLPTLAFAAYNTISLDGNTIISANGVNLVVVGVTASSTTVSGSSFTVDLLHGSGLTVTSADRRNLTVSGIGTSFVSFSCGASASTLGLNAPNDGNTYTATVTVESTTCSTGGGGGGGIPSGGGGGGGGSSIYVPPTTTTTNTPVTTTTTTNTTSSSSGSSSSAPVGVSAVFTKALVVGATHSDIKRLQQLLNSDPDTKIAASGVGSSGKETMYFGPATKKAVQKFQVKYKIAKAGDAGYGNVGPMTRAMLAKIFGSN